MVPCSMVELLLVLEYQGIQRRHAALLARRADAWLSFQASRSTYLARLHTVPRALDACGFSVAPRGGSAACSCVA